jgi:protein-S-isoprenylcysteine O-methyltransferase Ste14
MMTAWYSPALRFLKKTPNRSFIVYPLVALLWELLFREGNLVIKPYFLVLMIWGYGQYRFCGRYRIKVGGGGPGFEKPPERLVTSGIYRYIRNPMYLGHIIFLVGLSLTLQSTLAALITLGTAIWFNYRVRRDESRLIDLFGDSYLQYLKQTKRWIPYVF